MKVPEFYVKKDRVGRRLYSEPGGIVVADKVIPSGECGEGSVQPLCRLTLEDG